MSLLPWNGSPFEKMERVFFDTLDDLDTRLSRRFGNGSYTPNLDISEDADNFYILAELPGIDAKNVKVTADDDILTISGRKERKEEKKERNYHRVERSFGEFVRSLSLPVNVKAKSISGTFKDGLLELTLPKVVAQKPSVREIPLTPATEVAQNGHAVAT